MEDYSSGLQHLIEQAKGAIDKEIEAVLEIPAHAVLHNGNRVDAGTAEEVSYRFDTELSSLRFAEEFTATINGKQMEAEPVESDAKQITIAFPEDFGESLREVDLEWENDFVLRKIRAELDRLPPESKRDDPGLTAQLFYPDSFPDREITPDRILEAYDDGSRNEVQHESIEMALNNKVTFIWGPPGTGKTSTLGFIIANYLLHDRKVLFASNTNRAVDVGLLGVIEALQGLQSTEYLRDVTRFGELALENPQLDTLHFDTQLEQKHERVLSKRNRLSELLSEYARREDEAEQILIDGGNIPPALQLRLKNLSADIEREGGRDNVEARLESSYTINEHNELERKKLVCTTLAKVCTSELFNDLSFDAVVIDEASMANLAYMLVLASKAKKHVVVVGDPMQLPPIAVARDLSARQFLEQDIFVQVSGARTTNDLFRWHDAHPGFTCFFDTQYRLNHDLADIVSHTFYQGRLKTSALKDSVNENRSVTVIDSTSLNPVLVRKSGGRGFQPFNEVHQQLVQDLVRDLVFQQNLPMDQIGVLVPFRQSVYDLRRTLTKSGFGEVEVGTIHTFQGREKKVIIFDTVMAGEAQNGYIRHYSVRPFDERKNGLSVPRLLNVAFSRSKDRLLVIADMRHIRKVYKGMFIGRLLEDCVKDQRYL